MFECKANTDHFIGYRIKLYPTEDQKKTLNRQIEYYRFVYNWSLETIQRIYHDTGKFTRYLELDRLYAEYRSLPENLWLKDFPRASSRIAIRSAVKAFIYFFDKRNNFPVYKSKKKSKQIFGVRGDRVYLGIDGMVSIEGMGPNNKILYKGSSLPKDTDYPPRIYNAWITFDKDDYYLSFQYEQYRHYEMPEEKSDILGIDVGLRKIAVLSDGTEYKSPDVHKLYKRLYRNTNKAKKKYKVMVDISKRTRTKFEDMPKSNKLLKLEEKIRKDRRKISNKQNTFIHQISKEIVDKNPECIVLETISPQSMVHVRNSNGKLVVKKNIAREVYRQSLSKFHNYIEYKAKERDIPVIKADSGFPSTQICSNCGFVNSHIGSSKVFKCPSCGFKIDRDLNAAINLKNYAYRN